MWKKFLTLFLIIVIPFMASGCWDYNELDTLGIITGAGVEKVSFDSYEVTVQTIKTASNSKADSTSGKEDYIIASARGSSVFKAARNLSLDLSRRNYWPHTMVFIIGPKFAQEGIQPAIDFFTREPQRRRTAYFILSNQSPGTILSTSGDYEAISSMEIYRMIEETKINGSGTRTNLLKFIQQSEDLTGVGLLDEFAASSKDKSGSSSKTNKANNILINTGIFYNYKLIGKIPAKDTLYLNFIRDNIDSCVIPLSVNSNDVNDITISVNKSTTKIKPIIDNGQYIAEIDINVKGQIVEYEGQESLLKLTSEKVNEALKNKMENSINTLFNQVKTEYGVDAFGLGNKFANKYPYLIKISHDEWNKIFANKVIIKPHVNLQIDFTGTSLEKTDKGEHD